MIYRLARIAAYVGRQAELCDEGMWLDFLDDFGPALSRFLVAQRFVPSIPTDDPALAAFRRSLESNALRDLKPRRESVWILFAFKGEFAGLPPPFRSDGILLPFEWCRTDGAERLSSEDLMPPGLVALAASVRRRFGSAAEGWTLRPDRLFRGQVDFNLSGATFESGWGALACGLARALDGRLVSGEWPFSSMAWNSGADAPAAVGELARKFLLAADFGAEEIAVAPEQRREAERILAEVKARVREIAALRRLRIFNWRYDVRDFEGSVRRLCRCNAYRGVRRFLRHLVIDLAVFAGVFALICVYAWDSSRETVEHYADYVEDGGSVRGLFPLDERPKGATSYEFRRRGWTTPFPWRRGERLLRSVRFVNARGEVREDENDLPEHRLFAERTFAYDERGVMVASQCFGAGGRSLGAFRYSGEKADVADAVQGGNRHIDGYAFAAGGDRVRRLRYVRDGSGWVSEIRFIRDSGDVAAEDAAGVSRVAFRRDARGRILSSEYRDWRGEKTSDSCGVHRIDYTYEGMRLTSVRRYAVDGAPRCGADGGDEIVYAYDAAGNLLRRDVRAGGTNLCAIAFGTDEDGDRVSERHLDGDGSPRSEPWTERRLVYDERGNLIGESWHDANGRPLTRDSGSPRRFGASMTRTDCSAKRRGSTVTDGFSPGTAVGRGERWRHGIPPTGRPSTDGISARTGDRRWRAATASPANGSVSTLAGGSSAGSCSA